MKPRRSGSQVRRQATDGDYTGPFAGNCARPINEECGLVRVWECATHGPLAIANDENETSNSAKQAQLRQISREIDQEYAKAKGDPANRAAARRLRALEQKIGDDLARVHTELARERRRGHTASMVAHIASARLMRF